MEDLIAIVPCDSYEQSEADAAMHRLLDSVDGLSFVKPGMKIAVKANLVSMMKPESAATTHPALLVSLVKELIGKGASVVIGDSPRGIYNSVYLSRVYAVTGMKVVEEAGAQLNHQFEQTTVKLSGKQLKELTYTSYLDSADAIINFSKLKTHGMMGMSAAVKNMFGTVPGTMKPEYHFRFPNHHDFAEMLLDINDYFSQKVKLCIVDAVIGMEGNGPTQGKPRKIGAVLASSSPVSLDLACADLIGLTPKDVPTLAVSCEQNRIPDSAESLHITGDLANFRVPDYEKIPVAESIEFDSFGKPIAKLLKSALRTRPQPKKSLCISCKKCKNICPAKAITMKNGIPVINRTVCITCFCCQEFCPVGAMQVHRSPIAKLLNRGG